MQPLDFSMRTDTAPATAKHIPFILSSSPLEYCSNINYTSDISSEIKGVYVAITLISMICSIFVGITIFYNPKLRIHPSKLIGYMCFCEAFSCFNALVWAIHPNDFICYFGLHYAYSWYTFGIVGREQALIVLCESNQIAFTFFQTLSLAFNFCLCHDLIKTLQDPFYPGKRRMTFYFFGSILAAFLFTLSSKKSLVNKCFDQETKVVDTDSFSIASEILTMASQLCVFFWMIGSCIYAYFRLMRPGMSPEIRVIFMRKHIKYVITFIFIWSFNIAHSIFILFLTFKPNQVSVPNEKYQKIEELLLSFSIIAAMSTGFLLTMIRIQEPYFKFLIKKKFLEWFGELMDETTIKDSEQYINDSLVTFLNSSLNMELVHVILDSISNQSDKKLKLMKYEEFTDGDFLQMNIFKVKTIEIKNPEQWKVAKVNEQLPTNMSSRQTSEKRRPDTEANEKLNESQSSQVEERSFLEINNEVYVTEYAPEVFAYLRSLDNIDQNIIKQSLSAFKNRDQVFRAGESQGKSGSFFFFSHDKNFIIKTMTNSDLKTFKKLFRQYFEHVTKHHQSLLARIYGIYTVKMENIEPVHILLMGNTKKSNDQKIVNIFDLKGSTVNRETKGQLKPTSTLKDTNLNEICKSKILLMFGPEDRIRLENILKADSEMLKMHNIMDYSLLFAIEKNPAYESHRNTLISDKNDMERSISQKIEFTNSRHTYLSECGRFIYHIAIIDYLQDYNFDKKMENRIKMFIHENGAQISAIEPIEYQQRFMNYMKSKVIICQKVNRVSQKEVTRKSEV